MKTRIRKIIASLVVLTVLMLTISPINYTYAKENTKIADSDDDENKVDVGTSTDAEKLEEKDKADVEEEVFYDFNELYAEEIGEDVYIDFADIVEADENQLRVAIPVFDSVEAAGAYYRQCLVDRNENVKISINYNGTEDAKNIYTKMRTVAFEETDKPYEGDYLYWNWEASQYKPTVNDGVVSFNIFCLYRSTKQEEEEIDNKVSTLLNTEFKGWENKSDYENVKNIYDWITFTYDYVPGSKNHSSYSGLIENATVCQGFATSFYRLAREMGISSRVIAGDDHGWNIVKLGDVYYDVDTTWDAENRSDKWQYFLKCERSFNSKINHKRWDRYNTNDFNKKYPMTSKDYAVKSSEIGFSVLCDAHVQNYGWLGDKDANNIVGTTGESKRLEAVKLHINKNTRYDLGIEVMGHVQSIGWSSDWISEGNIIGTTNQARRLEAVKIRLVGKDAAKYDIYYQAHVQNYGWLGWARNGESAGTEGLSLRVEALKIAVVQKGKKPQGVIGYSFIQNGKNSVNNDSQNGLLYYKTHVQDYSWQNYVFDGSISGTTGESKRLEAISIGINASDASTGVRYVSHVETYGWEKDWKYNGEISGTTGKSKRLEAIRLELYGTMAVDYDIFYRVHSQDYGWLGWAKNGESAGTEGLSKRLEAIQIVVLPKGQSPTEGLGKIAFIK